MKDAFYKFVTGTLPQIKMLIVAVVLWLVSYLVGVFGLNVNEDTCMRVSNYIAGAIYAAIAAGAAKMATDGARKLQDTIPDTAVVSDGRVGPVTIAALKELANDAKGVVVAPLTRHEAVALAEARKAEVNVILPKP